MFVPIRLSHPPLQFLLTEYRYDLYPLRYESGCWISVAPKPMHNLSIGIHSFHKIIRSPKPFSHTINPRWDILTSSEQIPAIPSTLTFKFFSIIVDYCTLILCSIRCLLHLKQFLLTVSSFSLPRCHVNNDLLCFQFIYQSTLHLLYPLQSGISDP